MSLQLDVELKRRWVVFHPVLAVKAGKTTLSRRLLDTYKDAAPHETIMMSGCRDDALGPSR